MEITILIGIGRYGNEFEEDIEVTEEEYERLRKALSTGRDFQDCKEVKDIYDRFIEIADELAADSIREFGDTELAEEFRNDENLKASDKFDIWIECHEFEDEEFDDDDFDDDDEFED